MIQPVLLEKSVCVSTSSVATSFVGDYLLYASRFALNHMVGL